MSAFFEVCVKGFRGLMTAKPKWHFVRELISNSLDEESVKTITLKLIKEPRFVTIICEDDGEGFERLSDAYTLFAHTKKRANAVVRGRFNMGEKELASISKEMTIETTSGKVVFKDGKRKNHPRTKLDRGTIVTAKIRCSKSEFGEILNMVGHFFIPVGKILKVVFRDDSISNPNVQQREWSVCGCDTADWKVKETLETTLFDEKSGGMKSSRRKTQVNIHDPNSFDIMFDDPYDDYGMKNLKRKSFLYELGIPVQEIACKYHVDVNQKIPMNANRDSVKDSYLRDIYALVLNATHDQLTQHDVSEPWVKTASDDELVTDEAFRSIKNTRYGEKSVKWSSDKQANEDARDQGYAIIHPKELTQTERSRMENVGLVSASVNFSRKGVGFTLIERNDWTDSMVRFEEIAHRVCDLMKIKKVTMKFIVSGASTTADYGNHTIRINLGHDHWGRTKKKRFNFDPMDIENLATLMHELGHMGSSYDYTHDRGFYDMLCVHSAKFVTLALGGKS